MYGLNTRKEFVILDVETLGYLQREDKTVCLVRFDAVKVINGEVTEKIKIFGYKDKKKVQYTKTVEKKNKACEEEKALKTPISSALEQLYAFIGESPVVTWTNHSTIYDDFDADGESEVVFKSNERIFLADDLELKLEDFEGYIEDAFDVAEHLQTPCNRKTTEIVELIYKIMKKIDAN